MRLGPCVGVAAVVLGACGDNQPGFDLVAASEHFRVYVHGDAVAPGGMIEQLETHYRDTQAFLHFPEVVVDYHLFATLDASTLACTGTLGRRVACAPGHAVFSFLPVHEHELIHAYLDGVGSPPPLVVEGIAMGIFCGLDFSTPNHPPWYIVATEGTIEGLHVHAAGLTLFVYLTRRFGIDAFLDYYRNARQTLDPDIFKEDFEAFWQIPIDMTWKDMQRSRNGNGWISPICPCTQPRTLAVDGNPTNLGTYSVAMPLPDSDPGPYLFVTAGSVGLRNCAQDYLNFPLAGAPAMPGRITVARLLPERHYLSFDPRGSITATKGDFVADTCGAAQPVRIPPGYTGDVAMLATAGGEPTAGEWYARFTLDEPRTIRIQPPSVSVNRLIVCPGCDEGVGSCTKIPSDGGEVNLHVTGPEVVLHGSFFVPSDSATSATFALLSPAFAPP